MQKVLQSESPIGLENRVDVIGHDGPSNQVVSFTIEMFQGVRNNFSYLCLPKVTLPVLCVEIRFDLVAIEPNKLLPFMRS